MENLTQIAYTDRNSAVCIIANAIARTQSIDKTKSVYKTWRDSFGRKDESDGGWFIVQINSEKHGQVGF
ncbi:MAG TPA: hypothetical protein PKD56_15510 [Chitinophagales bacterium]|nr:hypothetical protein [Chitinophagales bacterium]